jgi:hypothetical protein
MEGLLKMPSLIRDIRNFAFYNSMPSKASNYCAGATSEYDDEELPMEPTQHQQQVKMAFTSLGVLALVAAATFSGVSVHNHLQHNRAVNQVSALAVAATSYHDDIAQELERANVLAAQIGDKVEPNAAFHFTAVRNAAQSVLTTPMPKPAPGATPQEVQKDREIVEGIIAVNANMVTELQTAQAQLQESHAAYLLDQYREPAVVAGQALELPISAAATVLEQSDGVVAEESRARLQAAIDSARTTAQRSTQTLTTATAYNEVKAACEQAEGELVAAAAEVTDAMQVKNPVVISEQRKASASELNGRFLQD